MITQIEENVVTQKTRELCQALLDEPDMIAARDCISAFLADESSRSQYESLMARGEALHTKQQRSLPLDGQEIAEFERQREALLANPVARGFLDAQEKFHGLQESIQQQVAKTLELGRVPGPEDFDSGSCGHGCGCHH